MARTSHIALATALAGISVLLVVTAIAPVFSQSGPLRPEKLQKQLPLRKAKPFPSHHASISQQTLNSLYADLSRLESDIYGHAYWDEGLSKRMERLEKSLLGAVQTGSIDKRFEAIKRKSQEKQAANKQEDQTPLLEYLEKKLFRQTYPALPAEERMNRLESHVFGETFPDYPVDMRLKKLSYAMPVLAKGVRLSDSKGATIATTRKAAAPTLKANTTQPSIRTTPSGVTVNSGDYMENVFKPSNGMLLRWMTLPVKVYFRGGTPEEKALTLEAVNLWNLTFPVRMVDEVSRADILVTWNSKAPRNPMTHPVLHVDESKTIRTVVSIDMTMYRTLPLDQRPRDVLLRGMIHQLGHAAGLWGHSQYPGDALCPMLSIEQNDIPSRWDRFSTMPSALTIRHAAPAQDARPSQRDINTLTRIYSQNGQDLKAYSPY